MKTQCNRCDGVAGEVTFANQVRMPIRGRVQGIDWCIHSIVAALNAGGIETVASCCGHDGKWGDGRIDLADGRVLVIKKVTCLLCKGFDHEASECGKEAK